MAIAISPDGKSLALDLQGTIWIMPSTGGMAKPVTDDLGDCHEPNWSPDGELIAFHSYRSGTYHIWTVRKDGNDLRQITSGNHDDREPCWSPDGRKIVFSSDRNGSYDIWQNDLITNELNQLTSDPANEYNPSVSSDGQMIAFVSEGKDAGICILREDIKTLLHPSTLRLAAPSWNVNGDMILFSAYERENTRLMLIDVEDASATEISSDEDIFPFRAAWINNSTFLYTADGKIKKRILEGTDTEIIPFEAVVSLDRSAYARKKYDFDDQNEHKTVGITGPIVSPDGKQVAFSALNDIYVQTIGGPLEKITDDPHVDLDPAWSPDGSTLAYISDRGGKMQLWLHNITTGIPKLVDIKPEDNVSVPAWSPDGETIAFFVKNEMNEWGSAILYTINLNTLKTEKITGRIFVPGKPCWAPDGKKIAFMALKPASSHYREGTNGFFIVSAEDKTSGLVTIDPSEYPGIRGQNGPAWSPDGTMMAYVSDGFLRIVTVDENGGIIGKSRQITEELAGSISWTGDSKAIVYMAADQLRKVEIETGKLTDIDIDLTWKPYFPDGQYIIHAGRLFNGINSNYISDVDILIDNNRIKTVEPHKDRNDVVVIDASDRVVMPGLFESHTHLHSGVGEKLGKIFLSNGITSVREVGADPYDALERKESWSSGKTPGPRLFTTGFLDGSRVYYGLSNPVLTMEHMQLELERAEKLGLDLIKTYVRMTDSMQKEIIEAAHLKGLPVSSHEIYPSARYNIDAVEHFRGTSRRGYSPKQSALNKIYDDVIQLYVGSGITVTPTIVMHEGFTKIIKEYPALLENKQFRAFYSEEYISGWSERPPLTNYGPNFHEFQKAVFKIINSGGKVTAGTDAPFVPYGTSLLAELWLFVDGGLTPFQALQSATIKPAEAAGVAQDLGSVEPGKLADLVIIDGDPLNTVSDLWNVEIVIKNGIRYSIGELLAK